MQISSLFGFGLADAIDNINEVSLRNSKKPVILNTDRFFVAINFVSVIAVSTSVLPVCIQHNHPPTPRAANFLHNGRSYGKT